ncbi:hypothetical protein BDN72DRAFT_873571 [Pluteus cervinus]|uniref:Uncharacterized protein n=1 Tax=Pluteus cervinus TaxID=181527 RepID=A0ACD3BGK8_9AGAR|nr:hypothetical protein BDN72DRAFT_873571 [Pluteus cervinus]
MKLSMASVIISLASLVAALPAGLTSAPVPTPSVTIECYYIESSGAGILRKPIETAGLNLSILPSDIRCWAMYETNGGIADVPLETAPVASSSHQDDEVVRVGVPIITSIGGLLAVIGLTFDQGVVLFMRMRARRELKARRDWTRRPGGWVDLDSLPKPTAPEPAAEK